MTKRIPLSKKIRFEIFKRDLFTCQYCGSTPPGVVLEVDHIKPVSKGGDNNTDNLLTSCFDCNRGKGATPLSEAPDALAKKIVIQKEKADQLKEFEKLASRQKAAMSRKVNALEKVFDKRAGFLFSDGFKKSVRKFFEQLPKHEVEDALDIALDMEFEDPERTIKYFCKVCWNKIRESSNA